MKIHLITNDEEDFENDHMYHISRTWTVKLSGNPMDIRNWYVHIWSVRAMSVHYKVIPACYKLRRVWDVTPCSLVEVSQRFTGQGWP